MKNRIMACLLAAVLILGAAGCEARTGGGSSDGGGTDTSAAGTSSTVGMEFFSDSDFKDVSSQTADAVITLSGTSGTISDNTRGSSGQTVTITSKGIYRVTGTSSDVTIQINDDKESGTVYLLLDNVTMTSGSAPCIYVSAADKVVIQCVGRSTLTYTGEGQELDAAIYAKDDVTVNGSGSLDIISSDKGIMCSDDLKITGAAVTINAASIGVRSKKTVRIGGGSVAINSQHDGIQIASDKKDVYFLMQDGALSIDSGYDGIDVSADGFDSYISLSGGSVSITSGGGAESTEAHEKSCKGLRSGGNIFLDGASVDISSADDAINGNGHIIMTGGEVTLASMDDAIHSDRTFEIKDGTLAVSKAYEGIEATEAVFTSGKVSVVSSDDGINASEGIINMLGADVYVNAGGDGLDANGSIQVKGGTVIVEASSSDGNGALDIGEGGELSISGGTVLALGSAAKAQNFSSGTQCSALVGLSGGSGTVITVDDGSGFTFTATKPFSSVVYSSGSMRQGKSYTITAGDSSETIDLSSGMYYQN